MVILSAFMFALLPVICITFWAHRGFVDGFVEIIFRKIDVLFIIISITFIAISDYLSHNFFAKIYVKESNCFIGINVFCVLCLMILYSVLKVGEIEARWQNIDSTLFLINSVMCMAIFLINVAGYLACFKKVKEGKQ